MSQTLRIQRTSPGRLTLTGDLDVANHDRLTAVMETIPGPLTLDVSGVTSMDSTALRVIAKRLPTGPVTLVGPSHQILRLLDKD